MRIARKYTTTDNEAQLPIINVNEEQKYFDSPINEAKSKPDSYDKSFARHDSLKHIIHEPHRGHKCKICDKSFFTGKYLKKHIKIVHKGHKDHKCDSCGKAFSQAGDLNTHIHTVHKGHKDHKCENALPQESHL